MVHAIGRASRQELLDRWPAQPERVDCFHFEAIPTQALQGFAYVPLQPS